MLLSLELVIFNFLVVMYKETCYRKSKKIFFWHFSVVAVGGDGLFSELLHGLLYRTRADANLPLYEGHQPFSPELTPKLRIGLIPAGNLHFYKVKNYVCVLNDSRKRTESAGQNYRFFV